MTREAKMSQKITEQDFFKSLAKLEALAKGSEDMNKSQICTGGNSEIQSWPGGNKQSVSQTGAGVGADEDGEYNAGKARKSIAEKVMKGQPLTAHEYSLLKSDLDGINKSQDEDEDDEDGKDLDPRAAKKDDDEDEDEDKGKGPVPFAFGGGKDMGKSMAQAAQESDTIQKGIEVSDFLMELTKSFALGLESVFAAEQGDFNKSLGEAVVNIGYGLGAVNKSVETASNAPATAPKSQLRAVPGGVQALQKGMGNPLEGLTKSQILDTMTSMMEKGQCSTLDVVKFETTGDLSPVIRDQLTKSLSGGQ
jgi:hypothetical protein